MDKIKEACSELSKNLVWWQREYHPDDIDIDLDEFNEMTKKFYEIAIDHLEQLGNLDEREQIMCAAIGYIDRALALPPLRGRFDWFDNTLYVLMEICNPNRILSQKELKFVEYLERGLANYKADVGQE